MKLLLTVEKLSRSYGARPALRSATFQLMQGELVFLLGANGAGKSTLLGCLAGAIRPESGKIVWGGGTEEAVTSGVLLQRSSFLYEDLSIEENLLFFAALYRVANAREVVSRLVARLELPERRIVRELSQGTLQKAALARAMVHAPSLLLLDEPFSNLDTAGRVTVLEMLVEHRQRGGSALIASHEPDLVSNLASRQLFLDRGRLEDQALGSAFARELK